MRRVRQMVIQMGEQRMRVEAVISESGHHHLREEGEEKVSVRNSAVLYAPPESPRPDPKLSGNEGAICKRCKQRKPRKGGRNVNHKFICADCCNKMATRNTIDRQENTNGCGSEPKGVSDEWHR